MKFYKKSLLSLLLLSLLFSACNNVKIKKKNEQQVESLTTEKVKINSVENKEMEFSDISIQYIPLDEPNRYDVQIENVNSNGYFQVLNSEHIIFDSTKTQIQKYTFRNLDSLSTYKISIVILNSKRERIGEEERTFKIPVDYVLQGSIFLNDNLEVKNTRVFVMNNTVIYTLNKNLKIDAVNFIVKGSALIQNFPNGAKAPIRTVGLSGGSIEITTETASGNLNIVRNSQSGGDGGPGCRVHCAYREEGRHEMRPSYSNLQQRAGFAGILKFKANISDSFIINDQFQKVSGGGPGDVDFRTDAPWCDLATELIMTHEKCDWFSTPHYGEDSREQASSCIQLSYKDIKTCAN